MDPELHCNACFLDFKPGDRAVATSCNHLFCFDCAKRCLSTDASCVVCQAVVTKSTIKAITVLNPPTDTSFTLLLAGQHPASALNAALSSVESYVHQQELYAAKKISHLEAKNAKMAEHCRQKLGELHKAYAAAKCKYEEVRGYKAALEADNAELQDKYAQKAMEAKKLRDNVQLLMATNDELQRACDQMSRRGGSGGGGALPGNPNTQYHHQQQQRGGSALGAHNRMQSMGNSNGRGPDPNSGHTRHMDRAGGYSDGGQFGSGSALGAKRARLPDPSPLPSPAFNAGAMRFDFHTPQLPRQGAPAPHFSGPLPGGAGFRPGSNAAMHPGQHQQQLQQGMGRPGSRGGGGMGGGGFRPGQQQGPALSGLAMSGGMSAFDL